MIWEGKFSKNLTLLKNKRPETQSCPIRVLKSSDHVCINTLKEEIARGGSRGKESTKKIVSLTVKILYKHKKRKYNLSKINKNDFTTTTANTINTSIHRSQRNRKKHQYLT